jgi:Tol biopolymer transport system component
VRLEDEPVAHSLAFSSDSKFAYVVTRRRKSPSPTLYEISLTPPYRVNRSLQFPDSDLRGVAVSSKLQRAFVSDGGQKKIWVVDLRTFRPASSFELDGHSPGRLVTDSSEKLLVVAAPASKKVFLLDSEDGSLLGSVAGLRELAHDLAISPDHRHLFVAHRSREGGVAVADLDQLVGERIVFASNRGGESHQIYAMDTDGKNLLRLTWNHVTDTVPRCSPDGRRIAFISDREGLPKIYVMSRSGKAPSPLARTDPAIEGGSLDWSPDGREIVFVGNEHRAIRVVDISTRAVRTLIDGEIAPGYAHHNGLCWKRTGDGILVESQSPASGHYKDIFLVDAESRPETPKVKQLTHERGARACSTPASSPDGKSIAFLRWRGGETLRDLVVMASDGTDGTGERCLLPSKEIGWSLRWFPDGNRLLYSARVEKRFQVYTIGIEGGKPTQLTDGDWDDVYPDLCDSLLSLPDARPGPSSTDQRRVPQPAKRTSLAR